MRNGITFNDKYHTYRDWGLKLVSIHIPAPKYKEKYIDVPGMDGGIDLTDIFGRVLYSDRDGVEIEFDMLDGGYSKWFALCEKISTIIHGKKLKMVLDDESNRFYNVRLEVNPQKSNPVISKIILSGKAEAFKYDVQTTAEPWKWDTFSFINGIIQQFDNIIVSGNLDVTIIGKGTGSNPIFTVSEAENLQISCNGNTYNLSVGKNRIPDIRIGEGEDTILTFNGTGILSVDYRGEYI